MSGPGPVTRQDRIDAQLRERNTAALESIAAEPQANRAGRVHPGGREAGPRPHGNGGPAHSVQVRGGVTF